MSETRWFPYSGEWDDPGQYQEFDEFAIDIRPGFINLSLKHAQAENYHMVDDYSWKSFHNDGVPGRAHSTLDDLITALTWARDHGTFAKN